MAQPEQIKLGVVGDDLVLLQAFTQFTQVVANLFQIQKPDGVIGDGQAEQADIAPPRVESVLAISFNVQGHRTAGVGNGFSNFAQL